MFCQRLMLSFFRKAWRFRDMFWWLCQSSLKATSGRSSTKENLTGTLYLHRSRNPWATIWDIHPDIQAAMWRLTNLTNMTSSPKQSTRGSPRTRSQTRLYTDDGETHLLFIDLLLKDAKRKWAQVWSQHFFQFYLLWSKWEGNLQPGLKTNLTRIPSMAASSTSLFGLDSWDDLWTSSNRWYSRLQNLLMLWTRCTSSNASWKKLQMSQ